MEIITAQMATYPARLNILPAAINSLLPQVDKLNVMLNGYNTSFIPSCCKHSKIKVHYLDNSMTDAAVYYGIDKLKGYIFLTDDDIYYPADYVEKTIAKIEEYERKYVVCYHGRVWNDLPIKNFYTDRKDKGLPTEGMYRCMEGFEGDHFVDCGGDGVMAYHSDTFTMRFDYCEFPNMSQLWIALKCNEDGVKQIAIGHPEGWFKDLTVNEEETIWAMENQNCGLQTRLVNERFKK
jgi:hypothetical protein